MLIVRGDCGLNSELSKRPSLFLLLSNVSDKLLFFQLLVNGSLNINLLEIKKKHQPLKSQILQMYSFKPYEIINLSDVSDRKYEKVRREYKIKKQSNRRGTVKIAGY